MIATDKGWNVYVGGNGGFTPGTRSCSPRTSTPRAGRGPSTGSSCTTCAPPTGCSARRRGSSRTRAASTRSREVVLGDSLGIAADLDAAMAAPRDGYVDEWAATLADPEKLRAVRLLREPPRGTAGLRHRARPAPIDSPTSAPRSSRARRWRSHGAVTRRSAPSCGSRVHARRADPRTGRRRRSSAERPVALFLARTTRKVHAVGHHDPFSGANVMARGIVGSVGGDSTATPSPRRCTSRSSTSPPASASPTRRPGCPCMAGSRIVEVHVEVGRAPGSVHRDRARPGPRRMPDPGDRPASCRRAGGCARAARRLRRRVPPRSASCRTSTRRRCSTPTRKSHRATRRTWSW